MQTISELAGETPPKLTLSELELRGALDQNLQVVIDGRDCRSDKFQRMRDALGWVFAGTWRKWALGQRGS